MYMLEADHEREFEGDTDIDRVAEAEMERDCDGEALVGDLDVDGGLEGDIVKDRVCEGGLDKDLV